MLDTLPTIAAGFAVAAGVHIAATRLFKGLVRLPNGDPPAEIAGYGRESYLATAFNQLVVMPVLGVIALRTSFQRYDMTEYLNMSVAELTRSGSYTEQLYLMTLVGAQLRDFLPPPATIQGTLAVHHSLVVSCCLLATFYPANGVLFVWGSWAMEMGSGAYNVYALFPSKATLWGYVFGMAASNVTALALMDWMYRYSVLPPLLRHVYAFNIVFLSFGRFHHLYGEWNEYHAKAELQDHKRD